MQELKIKATKRDVLGKKARFLRRQGIVPAHLFGHSLESQALQCDNTELIKVLAQAGTTRLISLKLEGDKDAKTVFVREIQRDAMTRQLLHVDFFQVRKDQKMTLDIPIVLVGEAPAMKGKGRVLSHGMNVLTVHCLPEKVPPQVEVDITVLTDLDIAIHVKDIKLDPEVAILNDAEQLVVKVSEITIKVEEEVKPVAAAAEAAAAEGEAGAEAETTAEGSAAAKPGAEAATDKKGTEKKAPEKKAPEKKAPEKKE
ncbi:MAG: 50S ribosomal protein L25 [Dehalococcoidales bacterium]